MRIIIFYCLLSISYISFSQLSIDSLKNELSNSNNDSLTTFIYRDIAWEYLSKDLDSALYFSNESVKYADLSKSDYCIGKANYLHGVVYYYRSEQQEAIEKLVLASKHLKIVGDDDGIIQVQNVIGAIYLETDNFTQAKKIYHKMLANLILSKDTSNITTAYNNLSVAYFKTSNYDSCIFYTKKSMKFSPELNANHYDHLSASLQNLNSLDSAIYYNNLSIKVVEDDKSLLIYLQRKAAILSDMNRYEEAHEVSREIVRKTIEMKNIGKLSDTYNDLASQFEKEGVYDSAMFYYRKHIHLLDSIEDMSNVAAIEEINTKYETEKKELEIAKQKSELEKHKLVEYGLFGGVAMLMLMGGTIFMRYREKSKANKVINEYNEELNQQNEELAAQRDEIESQKDKIEEAHIEIKDSITYAKRIQTAILPSTKFINENFDSSFVYYLPKDVVSGDFYWMNKLSDSKILFAAVDCTGHGVPGAFVSIVGYNLLNKMIDDLKLSHPGEILTNLNKYMSNALSQEGESDIKDGMDISLCLLDKENMKLEFAGANNPVYIIRNNELIEVKGDKIAIGSYYYREDREFVNHEIQLEKGDCIYSFSDGYPDQFGGPKGKKFMYKNFKNLLLDISSKPMDKQKQVLVDNFEQWKGDLEQVDDICIIGVKI